MNLAMEAPPVPLQTDAQGVVRVGSTRIPLDTVVFAFNQGSSAEEIVLSFPVLQLEDVYAVINYYLHNRAEVDDYLAQRETEAMRIKAENEKRFPPVGIRDRLLARRIQGEK
jgi:uncharacterized protein (DUF433 family)